MLNRQTLSNSLSCDARMLSMHVNPQFIKNLKEEEEEERNVHHSCIPATDIVTTGQHKLQ